MAGLTKTKRPVRFFNTTGPCNPWDHYMLPPEERLVGAQLHRYIRDQLYWVLHAPRQTGKTTFLQNWMREINSGEFDSGGALACYVSVERCQGVASAEKAMPAICGAVRIWAERNGLPIPSTEDTNPHSCFNSLLSDWARRTMPKALVVLFDETDVLEGETLISFLRQLRDGFATRGPGVFPVSITLVGMRDLKDYITAAKGGVAPNPGSPFNVKEDSAELSNFQRGDISRLFAQRTAETGQEIAGEALDYVYELSGGQPWIVNSLFKRATMRILDEDSRETVSLGHIAEAREQMIQARETHLDALEVRLRDPRIRRVVESIIVGALDTGINRANPDVQLAMDLGLVSWGTETGFAIANPIYADILTRYLNAGYHDNLPPPSSWQWQKADGSLDMEALLREFQRFWRENSEVWEEKSDYTEAFPHLLLMAFLQRVLNGGGSAKDGAGKNASVRRGGGGWTCILSTGGGSTLSR
ncbi:MAG: ATP-binding protein [Treponema sp.]|nr:ATP-binding protein [Treponema sp.]